MLCDSWTPDLMEERNERLAFRMRRFWPWSLIHGQLVPRGGREVSHGGPEVQMLLDEAKEAQASEWGKRLRALDLKGVPVMAEGTYGALGAYPLEAELPAVNTAASEVGLLTTANGALYMPIPARAILAPQAWRFVVSGRVTTTATAANLTWTPRVGNANSSPSLGPSAALAKQASITNAYFIMKGDITVQRVGIPGLNSTANGHFSMHLNTASGGAATLWLWGSAASASFDTTVAPGASANGGQIWLGMTASAAAADPFIVGQIHWMDWN